MYKIEDYEKYAAFSILRTAQERWVAKQAADLINQIKPNATAEKILEGACEVQNHVVEV